MRKIRKLIGLLLAAAMVFTMSAVAFADDSSETMYSITIKDDYSFSYPSNRNCAAAVPDSQ